MSDAVSPGLARVPDDDLWRYTRLVFLVSVLFLLGTVTLGFLNVFTTGALPRWQLLVHLHSGTLGWLTLSVFGATVWLFAAGRSVSDRFVDRVRWLALAMVLTFLGLIASFGLAFSQGGEFFALLAVFAPLAALTIWATAAFFLQHLRTLPTVTTAHASTAAGFLVLAIGVTFAVAVALGRAGVATVPDVALTGHVFGILGYEVLVTTGIVEWLVRRGEGDRWGRAGRTQVGLGVLIGCWVPLVVLLLIAGVPEGPLSLLLLVGILVLLVLFGLIFFGRIGVRALRTSPLTAGPDAWLFFATLWFAVGVLSFPLRFLLGDPAWWMTVNTHVAFVGIVSNLLFGVISARTRTDDAEPTWAQPAAMWLMNGGLVVFIATFIATGERHGALVMGVGVLLALGWSFLSLRRSGSGTSPHPPRDAETTD